MKYYVNTKTCIGKVYEMPNDSMAVSYAEGYAYGKKWETFNVRNNTTGEQVVANATIPEKVRSHFDEFFPA